jgi:hypothetical protein
LLRTLMIGDNRSDRRDEAPIASNGARMRSLARNDPEGLKPP